MHSRIFQINADPHTEKVTAYDYADHWFTREIADYVDDIDGDVRDELVWLAKRDGLLVDPDAGTIVVTSREAYFAADYERVKKAAAVLSSASLEDFAGGHLDVWRSVLEIRDGYDDRFGYYVDDGGEYGNLVAMDDWIRCGAEIGKEYHIINVLDYHF